MDNSTGLGIAAIVASITGPLIGVAMAAMFSRQEKKRETAVALFVKISTDLQEFKHVYNFHYRVVERANEGVDVSDLVVDGFTKVTNAARDLEGDRTQLLLLFGNKGEQMRGDLQSVMDFVADLSPDPRTPWSELSSKLTELENSIMGEMKRLHSSLAPLSIETMEQL